ncbi:MAG: hypothetical protein AAB697_00105 [Patescibacteria group bacterium]
MVEEDKDISEIFESLSPQGQQLLISMAHPSTVSGAPLQVVLVTSGLENQDFDKALAELTKRNLIRKGRLEKSQGRNTLVENPNGDRLALSKEVKKGVLTQILHFPANDSDWSF